MGEQENSVHTTRSSKKRPFASMTTVNQPSRELPGSKKRVPLGELTNSSNVALTQGSDFRGTQKPKPKPKSKLPKTKNKVQELAAPEIVGSSDGSQKCSCASLIYHHLHSLDAEEKRRLLPDYMEKVQKDVTAAMRDTLLDWLVEVAEENKLVSDTLYLCVSYIDRFISQHSVVNMEKDVLLFLNYEMGTPTIKSFLRIFTRAAQENCKLFDLQMEFLACYLAELSLIDYGCLRFLPSVVAASAIFLSRFTIHPKLYPWADMMLLNVVVLVCGRMRMKLYGCGGLLEEE